MIIDEKAICRRNGRIRHLESGEQILRQFTKDFYDAVIDLLATYDECVYHKFIRDWGTVMSNRRKIDGFLFLMRSVED